MGERNKGAPGTEPCPLSKDLKHLSWVCDPNAGSEAEADGKDSPGGCHHQAWGLFYLRGEKGTEQVWGNVACWTFILDSLLHTSYLEET